MSDHSSGSAPNTSPRAILIFFLATLLLFLPTWLWLGGAWLSDPYYSHGPLVLIIALYLAWIRYRTSNQMNQSSNNSRAASPQVFPAVLSWFLVAVGLGIHLWAILWRAYYLSALVIPFVAFGLIIALFDWHTAYRFIFPLAFLFLMIPLPLAERFGPLLEGWAASSATILAQWLGINVSNVGSQVFLPNSVFTVGIACGGLRSAVAIITLATLVAYIVRGPAWARISIVLAAIPAALAANTLRIVLLFVIAAGWNPQTAMDYFHDWSSLVLFLCAFILLLGLTRLLRCSDIRWNVIAPS